MCDKSSSLSVGGQDASEGAVRVWFGAQPARPKRLSEQRLSGVPPVEGGVVEGEQLLLRAHFKSANSRFFVQVVVDGIS